ncbi:MAG TPA: class I SAM-dependent methyltransferase [Flavisolibacter sp.]|jgi:hypothetical protein|nr:class I SAM-dependent methyltransferase [Flavisolibacter sp.]
MEVLDNYIKTVPSEQNAIDIFKDEWSSRFPGNVPVAGPIPLFEDSRIAWAVDQLKGINGSQVLELGPLEGGHSYMLEKMGAASVTAIEANSRAYLKCLIAKEVLQLERVQFLFGDCIEYLKICPKRFDVCIASGILYHMVNPVELLHLMSKVSDRIFIWTHYFNGEILHRQPNLSPKFPSSMAAEYNGFKHTLYRQEYAASLDSAGFCGGSDFFSHWLSREEILSCLNALGYRQIHINFEQPDHPHGPCFALTATR